MRFVKSMVPMPCNYKDYHPDWKNISLRIRAREGNRCKLCNAHNGKPHWKTGSKVVLTVAHLNHNKNDNREYNLAALCQRCHLIIDMPYHVDKRAYRKNIIKLIDIFASEGFTKTPLFDLTKDKCQAK